MKKMVKKLCDSYSEYHVKQFEFGASLGERWVKKSASDEELIKMNKLFENYTVDEYYLLSNNHEISMGELFAMDIDTEELLTEAPDVFWMDGIGLDDARLNDSLVLGFITRALECFDHVHNEVAA